MVKKKISCSIYRCQLVAKRQGYLLNSARACDSIAIVSLSVDAVDFDEFFFDILQTTSVQIELINCCTDSLLFGNLNVEPKKRYFGDELICQE